MVLMPNTPKGGGISRKIFHLRITKNKKYSDEISIPKVWQ